MRSDRSKRRRLRRLLAVLGSLVLALGVSPARGQGTGGATGSESTVGYIDSAIPANMVRERFEAADNFREPTRAEFFYAQSRPGGPGLPLPEPRINYQELQSYIEVAPAEGFSTFLEVPVRFLQPEVNANAAGLGDMNFGLKYALTDTRDQVTTFQFRTYVPTGDATHGLGNNHVSLEPALLYFQQFNERWGLEGELRLWVPVGGTDFAGDIVRYGLGVHYDFPQTGRCQFSPVAEFVGWTVLDGKESMVLPSGVPEVRGASGDTIVNAKLGVRLKVCGLGDFYAGYGRALTGDRWYENVVRVEYRIGF